MNRTPIKYFWSLDDRISSEDLAAYREAARGYGEKSSLFQSIGLLQNRVPVSAKAFLTKRFQAFSDQKLTGDFFDELGLVIARFEALTHCFINHKDHPLLISLHGDLCGAVRNIGITLQTLPAISHQMGEGPAFAVFVDFLESFSTLVLGASHIDFRKTFSISYDREKGFDGLASMGEAKFAQCVKEYQNLVSQKIGKPFPDSPEKQLLLCLTKFAKSMKAVGGDEVFLTAMKHRSIYGKSVQGLAYTRNPFSGKRDLYGVYQAGAEGKKSLLETGEASLKDSFPGVFGTVQKYLPLIESSFRDVMEVHFVSDEEGHVCFTQFDKAETTSRATVVSTMDLNHDGKLSDREAALRIKPQDVELLMHPTLDEASRAKLEDLGSTGVTAAPGTSVGHVFFRMADAIEFYKEAGSKGTDKRVILIADELLISDTPGLGIISGLVTKASGIASHAAVMARANGIPCIVGYGGLEVLPEQGLCTIRDKTLKKGELITLEAGPEGRLFLGEGKVQNLSFKEGVIRDVAQLITRVIKHEEIPMDIRVNINNAKDAEVGLSFGADGVGLCRTENMFMEAESLREIRNIVFTRDSSKCKESFEKLEQTQFQDFKKIFETMRDRVVNIRLMDLPLHDFVPQTDAHFEELCKQLPHLDPAHLRTMGETLSEHNPMLGLRACRFGLITPEVYDMQIRAIIRAAYAVAQTKTPVDPGIMFPLVFTHAELTQLKARVDEIEAKVREELRISFADKIRVRVGTMIELPAAALSSDQLAQVGEFFAFGTNDLTQTTLGMSRDDSAHYLPHYLKAQLLSSDPFKVLAEPVKELVETAVKRGRRVRPDSSFGICGEQGGDPATLQFCLEKSLNYVSCSPFRVLPTRIALVKVALTRPRPESKAA